MVKKIVCGKHSLKFFLYVLISSMILSFWGVASGMEHVVKQFYSEKERLFAVFDKKPKSCYELEKDTKKLFTFNIQKKKYAPIINIMSMIYGKHQWAVQPYYPINQGVPWPGCLTLEDIPELVKQYKIHLMPATRDIPEYMRKVLKLISKNKSLKKRVYAAKAIVAYPEQLYYKSCAPKIVIYVYSKYNAQVVLNKIYEKFKNEKGRGQIPQFNEKVTDFIFFAQGNRSDKQSKINLYEEPDKIYYDPEKIIKKYSRRYSQPIVFSDEDFHLANPALKR